MSVAYIQAVIAITVHACFLLCTRYPFPLSFTYSLLLHTVSLSVQFTATF